MLPYPQVNKPYFEERNGSWIYPTTIERRATITGAEAGFLIQNAGSASA
ncbi:hypothetical protein [Brucella inopinata]|nr:hypothetical protein [Brucella inopinata]